MTRHSNHSLQIQTVAEAATPVTIGLLDSLGQELNSQVDTPATGDPFDVATSIISQSPQVPFVTRCLKSILDLVGLTGKTVDSDVDDPGVVFFAQKHDVTGTAGRAASGGHLSGTISDGRILIEGIQVSGSADAALTGRVYGFTPDLDTSPLTLAYNASLPGTVIRNERYGMGKCEVGGTFVDRLVSVNLQFGLVIELIMDAGSIYPVGMDIKKVQPRTTIVTEDPAWLAPGSNLEYSGGLAQHSDTQIQWIKRELTTTVPASGGGFDDYTAEEHIQATLAGFVHVSSHYSASGDGTSQTTIEIVGEEESGTAPIVFDTTAVHSTS